MVGGMGEEIPWGSVCSKALEPFSPARQQKNLQCSGDVAESSYWHRKSINKDLRFKVPPTVWINSFFQRLYKMFVRQQRHLLTNSHFE